MTEPARIRCCLIDVESISGDHALMASRPRHYFLAHHALRIACAENPPAFFSVFASDERETFIRHVWRSVCEQFPEDDGVDIQDLGIATLRIGDSPTVVFRLPDPIAMTEAHMVAFVLMNTTSELPEEATEFRCFTLEYTLDVDGEPATFFCEWDGDTHLNTGDGPPPTLDAFTDAIESRLDANLSSRPERRA